MSAISGLVRTMCVNEALVELSEGCAVFLPIKMFLAKLQRTARQTSDECIVGVQLLDRCANRERVHFVEHDCFFAIYDKTPDIGPRQNDRPAKGEEFGQFCWQ